MLNELIRAAAKAARAEGVPIDSEPGGAIHRWALANCRMRPGTEFFVVFLVACEMADLDAQAEGFADQFERAAHLAFNKAGKR